MFIQGGIGEGSEAGDKGSAKGSAFVRRTAWWSFADNVTGVTALFEIAFEGSERDLKGADDIAARHAAVESSEHAKA